MSQANGTSDTDSKKMFKSLLIENIKYRTLLTKKYKERKPYQRANEKIIDAFIPGTILKLYKKDGDKTKEGEKLLVLEAMKMRNDVLSPFDGVVKKIHIKEGDIVKKDTILIEFE